MSDAEWEPSGDAPRASRGELQAKALRGVKWTLLHTVVSIALGFGVNILLARVLGVTDFGRLAYLTTVIGMAGLIAELGLGMGVIQFGAKAHAAGDRRGVVALLSKSQGFRLMFIAPVITLVVLAVVRVDPVMMALALIIGVWAKAALSGAAVSLTLENKTHRIAQNAMLVNFMKQAGVVAVVLTIGEADAVWVVRIVIGTLGVALALPYIDRAYRRAVLRPRLPREFPAGFWRYAIPAGSASILGNIIVSRTEVLFLTWWDMGVAAGLYAVAFGLAIHVFSPAQAMIGPLIPAISGLREVDPGAVGQALRRTLRASSTAVALLVSAVLAPMAILVPLIYGTQYSRAALPFVVLGLGAAVGTVGGPLVAFIQARLAGGSILRINIAAVVVNLVLLFALLPILGLWGAVIANLGGILARNGMLLVGEVRDTGLSPGATAHDVLPLVVGIVASLAALALCSPLPWSPWWSAVGAGVLGLTIYALGVRLTRSGLTSADLAAIESAAPRGMQATVITVLRSVSYRKG